MAVIFKEMEVTSSAMGKIFKKMEPTFKRTERAFRKMERASKKMDKIFRRTELTFRRMGATFRRMDKDLLGEESNKKTRADSRINRIGQTNYNNKILSNKINGGNNNLDNRVAVSNSNSNNKILSNKISKINFSNGRSLISKTLINPTNPSLAVAAVSSGHFPVVRAERIFNSRHRAAEAVFSHLEVGVSSPLVAVAEQEAAVFSRLHPHQEVLEAAVSLLRLLRLRPVA